MQKEIIKEQTNQIFKEIFEDSNIEIHDEMTAKEVEKWDSLSHLSMISDVEKKFGVKFKLKELVNMKNVGDMLRLIEAKLQA